MFVWESMKKAFLPIALVVLGLFLFNKYVYDINRGLETITDTFSTVGILVIFFVSETVLGLVPPEIFIAWTKKTADPILNLSILATLSYAGGLLSYFIGKTALRIKSVKEYLEVKMAENVKNKKILGHIAADEKGHYMMLKEITGRDIQARKWKIVKNVLISRDENYTIMTIQKIDTESV